MKTYTSAMQKILASLLTFSLIFGFSGFTLFGSDADATIKLKGDNVRISGSGVSYDDGDIVIEAAGTYVIKGTLNQGRVIVKAGEEDDVTVILKNAEITNTQDEALYFKVCGTASLVLTEGTENLLVSGVEPEETAEEEADEETTDSGTSEDTVEASGAALRAKCPLTVSGEGKLTVRGWINNGIASNAGLVLESGTYDVQAVNDGIKSDTSLLVLDGNYTVQAEHDGFSAGTDLEITDGSFSVTTGVGADEADMKTGDSSMMGNMGNMGGGHGNHESSGETSGEASVETEEETSEETAKESAEELILGVEEPSEVQVQELEDVSVTEETAEPLTEEERFIAEAEEEGAGSYFTARGGLPVDNTMNEATILASSEVENAESSNDISAEDVLDLLESEGLSAVLEAYDESTLLSLSNSLTSDEWTELEAMMEDTDWSELLADFASSDMYGTMAGFGSMEMSSGMNPFSGNDFMDTFDKDSEDSGSQKGLKATENIVIRGGDFVLDTEDDAIHCDGEVLISGGTLEIRSGDDGIHAGTLLTMSGGVTEIGLSFEGLEANRILLSGADITIVAQDDGMNANGSSGFGMFGGMGGHSRSSGEASAEASGETADASTEATTEATTEETVDGISLEASGEMAESASGEAESDSEDETWLRITDGRIVVTSGGDGLDSNGDLYIEGGEVYVSGPASDWDAAVDAGENAEFIISGGILAAGGYSGMAETPDSGDDTQCSIYYVSEDYIAAGTPVCLLDENGTELLRYAFANETNCVILSSPLLTVGETYTLQLGDESVTIEMTSSNYTNRSGGMFGMFGMGGGFGGR